MAPAGDGLDDSRAASSGGFPPLEAARGSAAGSDGRAATGLIGGRGIFVGGRGPIRRGIEFAGASRRRGARVPDN